MAEHLYERTDLPTLGDEFTETIRDQANGASPSTVTGLLLDAQRPLTRDDIAAYIGIPTAQIEGIIQGLLEFGWLRGVIENGWEKLELVAPVSEKQLLIQPL